VRETVGSIRCIISCLHPSRSQLAPGGEATRSVAVQSSGNIWKKEIRQKTNKHISSSSEPFRPDGLLRRPTETPSPETKCGMEDTARTNSERCAWIYTYICIRIYVWIYVNMSDLKKIQIELLVSFNLSCSVDFVCNYAFHMLLPVFTWLHKGWRKFL